MRPINPAVSGIDDSAKCKKKKIQESAADSFEKTIESNEKSEICTIWRKLLSHLNGSCSQLLLVFFFPILASVVRLLEKSLKRIVLYLLYARQESKKAARQMKDEGILERVGDDGPEHKKKGEREGPAVMDV